MSTEELEREVAASPADLTARVGLIHRYHNRLGPTNRHRLNEPILRSIREAPQLELDGLGTISRHLNPSTYAEGKELWLQQVLSYSENAAVLWNARGETESVVMYLDACEQKWPHRGTICAAKPG